MVLNFVHVLSDFVHLTLILLLFLQEVAFLGVQFIEWIKIFEQLKLHVFLNLLSLFFSFFYDVLKIKFYFLEECSAFGLNLLRMGFKIDYFRMNLVELLWVLFISIVLNFKFEFFYLGMVCLDDSLDFSFQLFDEGLVQHRILMMNGIFYWFLL